MIFRGLAGLVLLLLLIGALLGLVGADSEILSPSLTRAKADRIKVETAALADKNAYERQLMEIELDKQRALARLEVERKAQRAQLLDGALSWTAFMLSLGVFALMVAAAMHVVCQAGSKLRSSTPTVRHGRSVENQMEPFSADRVNLRSTSGKS